MIQQIQNALQARLNTLAPALPTAHENVAFTATTGQPYQRVFLLLNTPVDHALNFDVVEQRGIFQISLFYPANEGRVPAQQRAAALAEHFKPPQTLVDGGVRVELMSTVRIATGSPDGDRWHVPVSVLWSSFKTT